MNWYGFLNLYKRDLNSIDYVNTSMNSIVPIVVDDDISKYQSQIILPIVHNEMVDGLLIFVADNRKYLESNLRFAKTAKHFVELFSTETYL